ncbi:MAG TPA: hypothetical protein P5532_10720, partial [Planctomycetota bacterium]|nr:hypothetical protein [Planctomycetota bacterium]
MRRQDGRGRDGERAGLAPDAVLLCSSHTHSGPCTGPYIGWGEPDPPYVETLPSRIATACLHALERLEEAELAHAEVPCHGIGCNREYDKDAQPLDVVLRDDWRPAKPELTDTTCHVLVATRRGRGLGAVGGASAPRGAETPRPQGDGILGFVSYFGCHPVVCCEATRYIHGDYAGVATNLIEREHPGAVGLFLQGAQGDVNTCVCHKPETDSLLALDIIAGRYANAVRNGIAAAKPLGVDRISSARRKVTFSRKPWGVEKLRELLAECEPKLHKLDATDAPHEVRIAMVYVTALRRLLAKAAANQPLADPTEVAGMRIGSLAILGSGFETFQAIKNDVVAAAQGKPTLVCSFVNDSVGYAPDRTAAARGGYAADMVPFICASLPYANAHDELTRELLALDLALARG